MGMEELEPATALLAGWGAPFNGPLRLPYGGSRRVRRHGFEFAAARLRARAVGCP